ncbi:ead/Ea22-like family protein [Klebsiella quasipneumoniae]|uniref:ead/Ea22-like family protein n=1 Tax=Klebsiella quasipneumoniae TaxID=1463165 RepID=UPI00222E4618|nr:ead/Ea22-like family protein [Klebsiella quasipneumoniae]MDM9305210.1 ead/Ea22-like family protein [Klebsiella quasipneumoniae subsp. similipneumoniae]
MNIETVNELIATLESAGELSIREQKFLNLAKAYQQLAAENVALKAAFNKPDAWLSCHSITPTYQEPDRGGEYLAVHQQPGEKNDDGSDSWPVYAKPEIETPATDRIVAGIKADGRVEGAHFVANRMLAAWDAGFIEDTAKNAADIARMILTSTEFMANAPEGDFDRSFADGILEDIAQQLREGAK